MQKQFTSSVERNIETMIGSDGEVYLSANDLCAFIKRGSTVTQKIGQTVPHPLVAMQTKAICSALNTLSNSIEMTARKEKMKQPSRN
ncbi:hypothetical protein [Gimesia fumaroli]|uniref:Uncharacterized protein n=1 Tax=Gimesia fumaroli TaxID=2527976 RepID=A0A518IGF0_9PLAN|nr:hypothetical protein [Gimesia fumaroli]QDV50819.1 hypothetical protein Enr17x_28640 [Gimesia fumaroli]QDV52149.1 hypothetical protein Enr17x_42090 [Gimesia fumaroli]